MCVEARCEATIGAALVTDKVEELVLNDRSAEASAVLVVDEFRCLLIRGLEEGPGLAPVTMVIPEARAMQIVGAGPDLYGHRSAARQVPARHRSCW